jgi:hypothetical protein
MTTAAFRPHLRLKKSCLPAFERSLIQVWIRDIFSRGIDQQYRIEANILAHLKDCPDEIEAYKTTSQRCIKRLQQAEKSLVVAEEQDFWLMSFDFKNDNDLFEQEHPEYRIRSWLINEIDVTILQRLNTSVTMLMMQHMAGTEHAIRYPEMSNQLAGFIQALEEVSLSCLKLAPGEYSPMFFIEGA